MPGNCGHFFTCPFFRAFRSSSIRRFLRLGSAIRCRLNMHEFLRPIIIITVSAIMSPIHNNVTVNRSEIIQMLVARKRVMFQLPERKKCRLCFRVKDAALNSEIGQESKIMLTVHGGKERKLVLSPNCFEPNSPL